MCVTDRQTDRHTDRESIDGPFVAVDSDVAVWREHSAVVVAVTVRGCDTAALVASRAIKHCAGETLAAWQTVGGRQRAGARCHGQRLTR